MNWLRNKLKPNPLQPNRLKPNGGKIRSSWAWSETAMIAAVVIARLTGALQFLEWAALDTSLRFRPAEPMDDRVVIVGIREKDIRQEGRFPVSDQTLAQVLTTLQTYQPAAIGLDIFRDLPVEPGSLALSKAFQAKNIIVVEKVLPDQSGYTVNAPQGVSPDQVGIVDAMFDIDGKVRRTLLGTSTESQDYRLSLAIRLAETYLQPTGLSLDNGIRDPDAMRFGTTELPRLHPNSGGYVRADAGGNQMLINFRSGRNPFRMLSLQDLQQGVNPDWLRGKIVLIGYTTPSVKDIANSTAIATDTPALVYGVEVQAHVVSQIVSAVVDGRPLLQAWWDGIEYLWIIAWGVVGIAIGRFIRSPQQSFLWLLVLSGGLVAGSYGVLLLGWWIPVVPPLLVLLINGAALAAFYRYDEALRSRLADRQIIIDQTFNAIHSSPLQTLAQMLRQVKGEGMTTDQLLAKLDQLNGELRDVYDVVRREALTQAPHFDLGPDWQFDLQAPLHKTLYEVYTAVLERDFPGFATIKLKVFQFEPLDEQGLSAEQKRGLCRFLEEALCNVGKHAVGTTRLEVTCAQADGRNLIQVADNGMDRAEIAPLPQLSDGEGFGTRQARTLASQLGGRFQRLPNAPRGMRCELAWTARKPWFGIFL
jgi:CHASE2 domain-containing sensor protein